MECRAPSLGTVGLFEDRRLLQNPAEGGGCRRFEAAREEDTAVAGAEGSAATEAETAEVAVADLALVEPPAAAAALPTAVVIAAEETPLVRSRRTSHPPMHLRGEGEGEPATSPPKVETNSVLTGVGSTEEASLLPPARAVLAPEAGEEEEAAKGKTAEWSHRL